MSWLRHPALHGLALRGARYALIAAFIVGAVLAVLATLLFMGLAGLAGGDTSLAEVFGAGALVGAFVGAGWFLLNVTILAVGLWFKPTERWALGAALSTPVILAAVGFGYSIFRAYPL